MKSKTKASRSSLQNFCRKKRKLKLSLDKIILDENNPQHSPDSENQQQFVPTSIDSSILISDKIQIQPENNRQDKKILKQENEEFQSQVNISPNESQKIKTDQNQTSVPFDYFSEIKSLEFQLHKKEEQVSDLQNNRQEMKTKILNLQQQNEKIQAESKSYRESNISLKLANKELEIKFLIQKFQLKKNPDEINNLEINKLHQYIQELKIENSILQYSNYDLDDKYSKSVEFYENKIKQFESNILSVKDSNEYQKLLHSYSYLQQNIKYLKDQLTSINKIIFPANKNHLESQLQISNKEGEKLKNLQHELTIIHETLIQIDPLYKEKSLKDSIFRSLKSPNDNQYKIKLIETENPLLKCQIDYKQEKYENEKLKSNIIYLKEYINKMNQQNEEYQNQIKSKYQQKLKKIMSKYQKELNNFRSLHSSIENEQITPQKEQEIEKLNPQIKNGNNKTQEIQEPKPHLQLNISSKEIENCNLQKINENLNQQIENFQNKIQEIEEQKQLLQQNILKLEIENSNLQKVIENLNQQLENLLQKN
jgi:chromosome segregation ATPase